MRGRTKIPIIVCIIFLIFGFMFPIKAEANTYDNEKYSITNYKVDMEVDEDNVYKITEFIQVYFSEPQHGIVRKIPLRNKINRLDGTSSMNRAKISKIDVNTKYKKSKDSDYLELKIGDSKKMVEGSVDYIISYTYDIGNDKVEGLDELYFNIIGDEWDTTISNIEFTITMPKEFDETKIGFSSGIEGSTDSSTIIYEVYNNTKIDGVYQGDLKAGEGITVRLELPEGYFNTRPLFDFKTKIMITIPVILLVISFILWNRYGKDDEVIETVEFYPPSDLNSAEVGLLYKGKSSDKDVISLLIYLANEGYLKIEETENETQESKDSSFKIIKVKDYDGNNLLEKKFMDELFRKNKKSLTKDEIKNELYEAVDETTSENLKYRFHNTIENIKSNLNSLENRKKIFDKMSLEMYELLMLFILLSFFLITSIPMISGEKHILILILQIILPGIGLARIISALLSKDDIPNKILNVFIGVCIGIYPWYSSMLPVLKEEPTLMIAYIIGLTCILLMCLIKRKMLKRTPLAKEMLGKIHGFKKFIEVAEKSRLEALVMENPTYFYDILPYTYVLDISDTWIKKFETINLQPPDWYQSTSSAAFSIHLFNNSINSTMKIATKAMTSTLSNSGPGGSFSGGSGGGFSGGGSGGGGGRSW